MTSESDAEFVERIRKLKIWDGLLDETVSRLFALARCGAEAAARIKRLEAALRFYAGWPQGSAGNIAPFLMDAGRIARAALAAPSGALEEEK